MNNPSKPMFSQSKLIIAIAGTIVGIAVNAIAPILVYSSVLRWVNGIDFAVQSMFPLVGYLIIFFSISSLFIDFLRSQDIFGKVSPSRSSSQNELDQVIQRVQAEPEKAKPAWDLARVRLELYFDRNISQINAIFWLSVGVMLAGFIFILVGIGQTFSFSASIQQNLFSSTDKLNPNLQPYLFTPALISGVSGIITEFIGATFLFIYRSTIQQAAKNMNTLERIHSVGMAMQILDTISKDAKELQNKTKAEIVKKLLNQSSLIGIDNDDLQETVPS